MRHTEATVATAVADWYAVRARDLPWRRPGTSAWAVLVSEVMLQQTPVARVLPAYSAWLERWPGPAALAAADPGEVVRQWGRLGYPRRALRLQAAARQVCERHGGRLPTGLEDLLALPGVGQYTARAVAVFAHGQRHPVVDTNVRRVAVRVLEGRAGAPPRRSQLDLVAGMLPGAAPAAAMVSAGLMELGALLCTARSPRCGDCPLASWCAWRRAGRPAAAARRSTTPFPGSVRQARGQLLAVLRAVTGPVPEHLLVAAVPDPARRGPALTSLLADGLAVQTPGGQVALPTG